MKNKRILIKNGMSNIENYGFSIYKLIKEAQHYLYYYVETKDFCYFKETMRYLEIACRISLFEEESPLVDYDWDILENED